MMKTKLLLIDNGRFFQQNLGQRLRREGFHLTFARRLKDIRNIINQKNIDVVLLDLSGLKMEGIRMVEAIKSAPISPEIITINSADQLALSIDAMKLGAFDDFLIPIEINPLLERINAAVDWKQTRRMRKWPLPDIKKENTMTAALAEKTEANTAETNRSKHSDIRVLLVDDEKELVETLSERIRLREFRTDIALNGEQALEIIETQTPDVMVLDLRMPGIDGMEVLRRVKKSHPDIQVIILSGHGSKKDEQEAENLGACAYLQKPVEIDTLIEKIRMACN